MKKRKHFVVVCSVVLCVLLLNCLPQNPGQRIDELFTESGDTEALAKIREKSQVKNLPPVSHRVCFIGNSLIESGSQPEFLEDIAWGYGQNIKVDRMTYGGAYLSNYCDKQFMSRTFVNKNIVKQKLKKADIVVFQDYAGWQGEKTVSAIKKLKKYCKRKAKLYFYIYEDTFYELSASDYKKLRELKLSFIPKGQMINSMYGLKYLYGDLHVEGDYHPNAYNGYLSALLMHAILFEKKCVDFPREWFPDCRPKAPYMYQGLTKSIHGKKRDKKWEEFQRICRKLDELAAQTEENY